MMSVVVCPVIPVVNPFLRGNFPLWFSIPLVVVLGAMVVYGIVELIKMSKDL